MDPLELLSHAGELARREVGQFTETDLRRAVSACYYAIFHALSNDAAGIAVSPSGGRLRSAVCRMIAHTQVRKACDTLIAPPRVLETSWRSFLSFPLDQQLIMVARVFIDLQEARYLADYDGTAKSERQETQVLHIRAAMAHAVWLEIRHTPNAAVFLTAVLLGDKLGKRG